MDSYKVGHFFEIQCRCRHGGQIVINMRKLVKFIRLGLSICFLCASLIWCTGLFCWTETKGFTNFFNSMTIRSPSWHLVANENRSEEKSSRNVDNL